MLDLREQLRRYTEDAVERVDVEDVVAATADRPFDERRRLLARPVGAVAVAALVVLIVVGGVAWVVGSGQPDSTEAPPNSVPAAIDSLTWERVEMPGLAGPYLWFDGVIEGGPGLIAVGSGAPDWTDMVWTSRDGIDWVPAAVEDSGGNTWAFDVAAGGPGFVAVGPGMWTSTDGLRWSVASIDGAPPPGGVFLGEARAVTVGGPGLVAVGIHEHAWDQERAIVWTSVDGTDWWRVPHDEAVFGDSQMFDVVAGGPGLVAVGVDHRTGSAAVWTSVDGLVWSQVPHDPAVFGDGSPPTEILGVAAGDAGLVAVGHISDDAMGIWTSPDGTTWAPVVLDPAVFLRADELTSVISIDSGFVAAGHLGGADFDGAGWFSVDGTTWTRLDDNGAFGGPGHQRISDITPFEDGFVAVGLDTMTDSEAVWIARPAE